MPRPDPVIEAFLKVSNFLTRTNEIPAADWFTNDRDHSIEIYSMRSDLYLRQTPGLGDAIQTLCKAGRWLTNTRVKA